MKKQMRIAGRHLLLYAVIFGLTVGLITLACMPAWMARAGGAIGCGWWAFRYICWTIDRPRKIKK